MEVQLAENPLFPKFKSQFYKHYLKLFAEESTFEISSHIII